MRQWQYLGHVEPILPIEGTRLDWYVPLSEPVRVAPPLPLLAMAAMPEVPWSPPPPFQMAWMPDLSEPVRFLRPFLYETGAERPPASIAVVITTMGWYQQLSEPTRPIFVQPVDQSVSVTPPIVRLDWFQPLSEPTRRRVFQFEAIPAGFSPAQPWTIPTAIHVVRASFSSPSVSSAAFSSPRVIRSTFASPSVTDTDFQD